MGLFGTIMEKLGFGAAAHAATAPPVAAPATAAPATPKHLPAWHDRSSPMVPPYHPPTGAAGRPRRAGATRPAEESPSTAGHGGG